MGQWDKGAPWEYELRGKKACSPLKTKLLVGKDQVLDGDLFWSCFIVCQW